MSAAASLTWPGSRNLAGWWPSLARWQPRGVWLHLFHLHRVDALVSVSRGQPLDQLNRLLLESLNGRVGAVSPLSASLGLDTALIHHLFHELETAGLVQRAAEWQLTDAGREALSGHRHICTLQERRVVYFAEGDAHHPGVRFLPLDDAPLTHGVEPSNTTFDIRYLQECVAASPQWKQQHGFPVDVCALASAANTWQNVVIVRPEQVFTLLLPTADGQLLGFAVQPSNWLLQSDRPILTLGESWRETLPELTTEPTIEDWRQAWRNWGQPRNLPVGELEACHLERIETRLRIHAPRPLVDRLRAARSDAIKGEAWLLSGVGERTRCAVQIELAEQ